MSNTNIVPQGLFGPGILYLTRTDIANGTPMNVGFVNEFSYDFSGDSKELFGQNQFPLLIARSTIKATGKIKAAALSGNALNVMLLGGTWTNGTQYDIYTAAATAIPGTPYQITPTIPSSGTADGDLGVIHTSTGVPFTKVASAPAAGQYSYSAGVYTFASADTATSVITSQSYSFTAGATGQSQIVTNQLIGTTPTFQLDYKTVLYGATYYVRFYNCVGTKAGLAHKISDFAMPEYDFGFFANASQQVMLISVASQA
ncbi:MAG TPA: hypothetical protein VFB54_17735 [Burkholderiales bacterium]|nr:hypothetical protein [Burkholderiales bacterium]